MTECAPSRQTCPHAQDPLATRFDTMIQNCHAYASRAHDAGTPIVGILCEYTPRELIMAAGAIPVCLCGGSHEKIMPAEKELPTGLCPLIKSTYGYYCTRTNPFLDMANVIVAETTCDGKKKMYELMGRHKEMYILELPQKPDDPDAREHWRRELEKFKQYLETRFHTRITEAALRSAIDTMNRERRLRRQLAEMNQSPVPAWTGRQLLRFKSIISGLEEDLTEYQRLLDLAKTGYRPPTCPKVRVLLTGVPIVHGAEKIVDLIELAGGAIVCMENCTGLKPIREEVATQNPDPIGALAEKYFHLPCSVMTANHRRMALLQQLISEYRPDCIMDLVWQGCLTYDVEAYLVKQLADSVPLPYLKIVTDYSPSDSARIALRVEALLETAGPPAGKKGV